MKRTQHRYIVGIDPDLHKSGFAAYCRTDKEWKAHKAVPNEDLTDALEKYPTEETIVYIEAGWVNEKSNWRGGNYNTAQAKAKNVGQNQGAGKLISKIIQKAGFEVVEIAPLKKGILKSKKGSWTPTGQKYIVEQVGITARINDDVRDAIYIVDKFK